MKVAVMQPYLFPYIGYFQMIKESDKLIFYDSVDYIQRGYINRNLILSTSKKQYFTVPVKKTNLGTKINEVLIYDYSKWRNKFLKQLKFSYSKAPFYSSIYGLIESFLIKNEFDKISELAAESIKLVSIHLNLSTEFSFSSNIKGLNTIEDKIEKLEYILLLENANTIILPPGSKKLYKDWKPKAFNKKLLELPSIRYRQFNSEYVENLSIIDVLMFNSHEEAKSLVNNIKFQ